MKLQCGMVATVATDLAFPPFCGNQLELPRTAPGLLREIGLKAVVAVAILAMARAEFRLPPPKPLTAMNAARHFRTFAESRSIR